MTLTNCQAYNHLATQRTEDKEQILLMLLEGALKFSGFARRAIEEKNPKIRGENISKILAIVTELDCALNREIGGELAENLARLYQYMMMRLTVANTRNDTGALDEVENLLIHIKEGFEGAVQKLRQKTPIQQKIEDSDPRKGLSLAI